MNFENILQSIKQGILICGKQGQVVYCNTAYENFVGHTLDEMKGNPVTAYRRDAQVPRVLHTGKEIESIYRIENSQHYFASIYPVYENGEITGTISTITPIEIGLLQEETVGLTLREQTAIFQKRQIENMLNLYGSDLEGKKKAARELDISLASLYEKLK